MRRGSFASRFALDDWWHGVDRHPSTCSRGCYSPERYRHDDADAQPSMSCVVLGRWCSRVVGPPVSVSHVQSQGRRAPAISRRCAHGRVSARSRRRSRRVMTATRSRAASSASTAALTACSAASSSRMAATSAGVMVRGCTAQMPIRPRSFSRVSAGEAWTRAPLTATTPACSRLVIASSTSARVRPRSARYIRSRSRPRTRAMTSRTTKYSVLCIGARASPIVCGVRANRGGSTRHPG
jgi:hypothetical protein